MKTNNDYTKEHELAEFNFFNAIRADAHVIPKRQRMKFDFYEV
jgi:hypothetical protein